MYAEHWVPRVLISVLIRLDCQDHWSHDWTQSTQFTAPLVSKEGRLPAPAI